MMRQTRLASLAVALLSILGIAGAVGCGGGATAQPAEFSTAPATLPATATLPTTPTPSAAVPDQTTPTPAGWVPPTGSVPPNATPFELPYRVTISGPDTAHPGDKVTYEIHYQCLFDAQLCDHTRLTLRLDWPEGGSLIGFSPAADMPTPLGLPAAAVTLHGAGGADEATFRIADGFRGDFWLGIRLTGNSLDYRWPDGTVDIVHTRVSAGSTP
jgi:hypothetical protein